MAGLFTVELNDHIPATGTIIEVDQNYLLPGSQNEAALGERNGQ